MPARRKTSTATNTSATLAGPGWNLVPADTRILVIDDNEDSRETLHRLLTRGGFTVEQASDAGGGLELLNSWEPDLVVCDVNLPDRSGMDVCREIKYGEHHRHIFVARIHALARIQQTTRALRNSEQRFLTLAKTAPTGIIRTDSGETCSTPMTIGTS